MLSAPWRRTTKLVPRRAAPIAADGLFSGWCWF
jgi:hypothetical protein